jgi:hypothetical protein
MGVSGQRHTPAALLPPGKGPLVPIGQEAGWASEPVWTQEAIGKMPCPRRESNPDRPVVQPVVRHYTAWANPAHHIMNSTVKKREKNFPTRYYCRWTISFHSRNNFMGHDDQGTITSQVTSCTTHHSTQCHERWPFLCILTFHHFENNDNLSNRTSPHYERV